MSRGLDERQRLLLVAAVQVERRYRQDPWLPLGMVLCAAWTPEVVSEAEAAAAARTSREAAEAEAWKREAAEDRAAAEAGAAAGDPAAAAELDRLQMLDVLGKWIRASQRPRYAGAPLLRHSGTEQLLNPSRVTASLSNAG